MDETGLPEAAPTMRRYVLLACALLFLLLAGNAGLCVLADPYCVIGTPAVAGLTRDKPAAAIWPRVSKAYLVARAQPRTLLIGSSTTDIGFDPESAVWPASLRPVFNLGIDGALPETELGFLRHALAVSHPVQVILAANFIDSVVSAARRVGATQQSKVAYQDRLRVLPDGSANPDYARGHLEDLVFSTLSFTATLDSVATLLDQQRTGTTLLTAQGWNNGAIFRTWARQDGAYGLFMNKDREKIVQFLGWKNGVSVQLSPVAAMVAACRAAHVKLVVTILPNHSDEMETLHLLGLDGAYDAWKTDLLAQVSAADKDVPVWDFSGFSSYTTEELPAPGDRSAGLRWFWEPVHFKTELGDLMIARVLGAPQPADLGVKLTPANVAASLAAFHAGERQWAEQHPADVARLRAVIDGR
jgi:hypothetical protein